MVGDEKQPEGKRDPEEKQKYADADSQSAVLHSNLMKMYP